MQHRAYFCFLFNIIVAAHQLHGMEEAPRTIAGLLAVNSLPHVEEDGFLNLADLSLVSTAGIEEVPRQPFILSLSLAHNALHTPPEYLFPHLTYLDISHNPMGKLPPGMLDNLELLQRFYASGINLTEISPPFFSKLRRLKVADLSSNALQYLPPELWHNNPALKKLYLHTNYLTALHPLALLAQTRLRILNLASNRLSSFPKELCAQLTHLRSLNLANNELVELEPGCFEVLGELRELFLTQNKLRHVPTDSFRNCTLLRELNVGYNQLSTLSASTIEPLTALRGLILRANAPSLKASLPEDTARIIRERSLYVGDQFLLNHTITPRTVKDFFEEMRKQQRMNEIIYTSADHEDCFVINLSNQHLTSMHDLESELRNEGIDPVRVCILLAHNNYLTALPCAMLNKFTNLRVITLRTNLIESLIEENPNWRTSRYGARYALYLSQLKKLVLSDNKITSLPRRALFYMPQLTTLMLDQNELELIEDGAFEELENLQHCYLARNRFAAMPTSLFCSASTELPRLQLLDLAHNQLGTAAQYTFPPQTFVHFHPQNPQPLQVVAAQSMLRILKRKNSNERLATLRVIGHMHKDVLVRMAPESIKRYLTLDAQITECMLAFDGIGVAENKHDQALYAEQTWLSTLYEFQEKNWAGGLGLFLEQMATHPMHQICMNRLCRHMKEQFETKRLALIGEIIKTTPSPLFDLYLDAASDLALTRISKAREVYDLYLDLTRSWHKKNRSLLILQGRAIIQELNRDAEIEKILGSWKEEFDALRAKIYSWDPEMQCAFFELVGKVKLKGELAKYGITAPVFAP